ncbi:MAG: archaemetzincin, partial [Acidobacteria bacterium]|nr:archaemetzincin [Acidobacteriota bacterium]
MKSVELFFQPMGPPQKFDWLAAFHEPGQTFDEFLQENPTMPTAERRSIYVQPLGKFTATQKRVIDRAVEYLSAFYNLEVRLLPAKSMPKPVSTDNVRMSGHPRHRQIRTGYILDEILLPTMPDDAAALIAFTDDDLYPDSTMSFVFGQASLENRVGVWSLFRLDDAANENTFLMRTLKVAAHETGHMFGIRHCTKYECVMSGTNHLGETDRRPLDACP